MSTDSTTGDADDGFDLVFTTTSSGDDAAVESSTPSELRCSTPQISSNSSTVMPNGTEVWTTSYTLECYEPQISATTASALHDSSGDGMSDPNTLSGLHTPFAYSSTPQSFAISGSTVLAWCLLIMLLASKQTKPWFQTAATTGVCAVLTVTMAQISNVMKEDYMAGEPYDTSNLDDLHNSSGMKALGLVTMLLLWFAQLQTLCRLSTRRRHLKRKLLGGLVVILTTTIFSALQEFLPSTSGTNDGDTQFQGPAPYKRFVGALPWIAYLLSIGISIIYAAWITYWSLLHRRHAYPLSPLSLSPSPSSLLSTHFRVPVVSVWLLALLSLVSAFSPVVFFALDLTTSKECFAWLDYVRHVGELGASLVVWEWVGRVREAERREERGGVLGMRVWEDDLGIVGAGGGGGGREKGKGKGVGVKGWSANNHALTTTSSVSLGKQQQPSTSTSSFTSRLLGWTRRARTLRSFGGADEASLEMGPMEVCDIDIDSSTAASSHFSAGGTTLRAGSSIGTAAAGAGAPGTCEIRGRTELGEGEGSGSGDGGEGDQSRRIVRRFHYPAPTAALSTSAAAAAVVAGGVDVTVDPTPSSAVMNGGPSGGGVSSVALQQTLSSGMSTSTVGLLHGQGPSQVGFRRGDYWPDEKR
ncbi:pH-response regulator protein palH/rim21 [Saitoella coloradoensis]